MGQTDQDLVQVALTTVMRLECRLEGHNMIRTTYDSAALGIHEPPVGVHL
ncbi:MAG: hypothetical protein JWP57_4606 [Spirosoma sp.]|nr:hypothetical protein [Spirosoma sp.]